MNKLIFFAVGIVLFLDYTVIVDTATPVPTCVCRGRSIITPTITDAQASSSSNFNVSALTPAGDNKWYYIPSFFKATWYKSYQICRYHGMNLVSLQTDADQLRLSKLITSLGLDANAFWTSGSDLAEDKKFVWLANGRSILSTLWHPKEPNNFNNLGEHCVTMVKTNNVIKLNDDVCTTQYLYICEYVKDYYT